MRLAEVIYNDKRLLRIACGALDELRKDQVEKFLWYVQHHGLPWVPVGRHHILLALRELEMIFYIDPERDHRTMFNV